jgi:TctA family transporter
MKYLNIFLKFVFSIMILLPVASLVGILLGYDIQPKPEYYNNPEAYNFIKVLMDSMYITVINAIIFTVGFILLWTKRVALASALILPITVNIVAFHAFLDGGLFTAGAVMGNIMFLLNIYFIWQERQSFKPLLSRSN